MRPSFSPPKLQPMEIRRSRRISRTESVSTTLSTNCNRNCNEEEEEEGIQSCVVDLPSSIILDILSRLPTRTLLKCRCVCKIWQHSILLDPYFTKIRLVRAVNEIVIPVRGSLYLLELGDDPNYVHRPHWPIRFRIEFNFTKKQPMLVGSCNGLLCLKDHCAADDTDTLYISNPILGECVVLPKIKANSSVKPYIFGFSPTTGHYKIVSFKRMTLFPCSEVEVYTLGTDKWRNVGHVSSPICGIDFCDVTLNGAVHWRTGVFDTTIYSFDIDEEHGHPIPIPTELRDKHSPYLRLGVVGNCLSIYDNYSSDYVDIWFMKDYGVAESWTKVHILKTSIPRGVDDDDDDLLPVTLWRDGDILFSRGFGFLVSYNHKNESFTELKVYRQNEKVKFGYLRFHALPYRPTFFSLKDVASRGGLRIVNVKSKQ